MNTGTKGHPEALEGLEEGDEPHRLSYIRQANTHVPRKGKVLPFGNIRRIRKESGYI